MSFDIQEPEPVLRIRMDPDVWGRIRILAIINDHKSPDPQHWPELEAVSHKKSKTRLRNTVYSQINYPNLVTWIWIQDTGTDLTLELF
jgi:hypothetical protein